MVKILVDDMPDIPEQCPFAVTRIAKCGPKYCDREFEVPVNFCILSEKICKSTDDCERLKVN